MLDYSGAVLSRIPEGSSVYARRSTSLAVVSKYTGQDLAQFNYTCTVWGICVEGPVLNTYIALP